MTAQSGPGPTTTIVVGFDRSPASLQALVKTAELGSRLGAHIYVVHAVDLGDYPVDPDGDDWENSADQARREERAAAERALAGYGWGWSYRVARADPAEALARTADEVDALMIVVGTRSGGRGHLLERLLSPSVSHRVVNRSGRPVLVVSHHDERT